MVAHSKNVTSTQTLILLPANMDDTAPFAIMSSHHQRAHLAGTGYRSTEPQTTLSNRSASNDKARISGLCLLQNSSSSQFSFYRLTCGIHNLRVVVPGHATANDTCGFCDDCNEKLADCVCERCSDCGNLDEHCSCSRCDECGEKLDECICEECEECLRSPHDCICEN